MLSASTINVSNASTILDITGIQYFKNINALYTGSGVTFLPILPNQLLTLDIEASPIANLTNLPSGLNYLYCPRQILTSLPSLPPALLQLQCQFNSLTSLPALPSNLQGLICSNNLITSLPNLPSSLTYLDCNGNQLSGTIPTLPPNLNYLDCSGNRLSSLPAIPASVQTLDCEANLLTSLPTLPFHLNTLDCWNNAITNMPALPDSIWLLNCAFNQLTSLPVLPSQLTDLLCSNNQLSTLPALPLNLWDLECDNNTLVNLPILPANLYELKCDHNQLTALPDLPSQLDELYCNSNPGLSCLPRIYSNGIDDFFIDSTNIHCLPDRFSANQYDINPNNMPLCPPGGICPIYYNIAGSIHFDTSSTCLQDSLSPGQPIINMKVELLQNGQVVQQFYTLTSGEYSFLADSLGSSTVYIDTTSLPLSVECPASDANFVTLSPGDSVLSNVNFGMICTSVDYGVFYIWGSDFMPASQTEVNIGAGNTALYYYNAPCFSGTSGTVVTTFTGPVQYVGPAPGALNPSIISGNTLTYNISDLDSLVAGNLNILLSTNTTATSNDFVFINTTITPLVPDADSRNNSMTQIFLIEDSWDPNYKAVYPLDTIGSNEWLTYTIHFQNTGNDTAYSIMINDTLSPYVDPSTFKYLGSSNKPTIQLFGNLAVFTLPKINLPDSAQNPAGSQGWIQYKVKSLSNLRASTQITNTAYIYFDFNPPVITDTTLNIVNSTVGIRQVLGISSIHLYPNPNKGSFTLQTSNNIGSDYTISDMLGNVVAQQTIRSDSQAIELPEAAEGVYTLVVKGAQPLRFVIVR
jgi:Leucine-rich repeat (LRR) protein